ncbi:MAG: hypothetical protein ACI9KE_000992 [Polyangiales bacterium]|jgi:hypothetical protein
MNRRLLFAFVALQAVFGVGCASVIPNTNVEDTPDNRDVVSFLEEYRHAVEDRNVRRLLDLASPTYLDDNGTPGGDDDLDYDGLRDKLASWRDRVLDVRYDIKYRRVTWEDTRVFVEYRYTASFRVATSAGEDHWARRVADNRIVLSRDDEADQRFRILDGM